MNNKYGNRESYDEADRRIKDGLWGVDAEKGFIISNRGIRGWNLIGSIREGYVRVRLGQSGKHVSVHRVIWEYVHGPSDLDLTINHKNGNHSDNRIDNLELISNQENAIHGHTVLGRANGSRNKGATNPQAKLTEEIVSEIKAQQRAGVRGVDLARKYEVGQSTICNIKMGRVWEWVE